jgi:aminoglycoside phosphotransferase (APT) family kinase protein
MAALVARAAGVDEPDLAPRHGWANEAWIGGDHVVRISSGRLRGSFAHEAAVIAHLEGTEVPVAGVVAHGRVSDLGVAGASGGSSAGSEWIVTRRLPGDTLAVVWPGLAPEQRRNVGVALGRLLQRLHASVTRVGDTAPEWWVAAHEDPSEMHNAYRPRHELAPRLVEEARALAGAADRAILDDVAAFLADRQHLFVDDSTGFVHTDLNGHNVMVATDGSAQITGLIDWEGARVAAPDLELDMLLRYLSAADRFPARPGDACVITAGDAIELAGHVAAQYPELFAHPQLLARLEIYDVHWHLIQLLVTDRLGTGAPAAERDPAWERLEAVLSGRSHLTKFALS